VEAFVAIDAGLSAPPENGYRAQSARKPDVSHVVAPPSMIFLTRALREPAVVAMTAVESGRGK